MKQLFISLILTNLLFSVAGAAATNKTHENGNQFKAGNYVNNSKLFSENKMILSQQNLIGEVTAIDQSSGRITIKNEAGASVIVAINDKTAFRRVAPGQTSIANAEQITIADVKVGDRVLVPGGAVNEQTAVRQVIVMAREAITAQRNQELENRRARTVAGRVAAINPEKREITIQSRGRSEGAETIIISASENAKFLRYAPDSLKLTDAVAGSFADLRVGDQVRTLGDRSADGTRVTAEEIVSGSVMRTVGSIVEVNATRGEVVVKNAQTGQTMTVAIGKNTTLRRIPEDIAKTLKERANQRGERQRERASRQASGGASQQQTQAQQAERQNRRENRRENRTADGGAQGQGNRGGFQQQFNNLPTITVAELKKGDAVLITGTGGADNTRMTAVSIVTGESDLQQVLQRTQGGRNNQSPNSPGLPGNVGGGNPAGSDDDPRN